jgi:hypothetical protein
MTTTQQIITTFTEQVDTNKEYTRAELGKLLTQVFNDLKNEGKPAKKEKKPKKEDGEEKKKREPTAYNLFVKEKMPLLKEEFPNLSRQDLMKKVGEIWRAKKEAQE